MAWSIDPFLVGSHVQTRQGHRTLVLATPQLYSCKVAGDDYSYADFFVHELTLPDHMVVELIVTFTAILLLG